MPAARAMIKMSDHQCWWLAGGYNLEVDSMVVTCWIVAFLHSVENLLCYSVDHKIHSQWFDSMNTCRKHGQHSHRFLIYFIYRHAICDVNLI